ncbi:hypothetical protein P692DRAFT_201809519 [Suillus brevipes Sb2]|nr:hypothetical protein P692DRAFT_201809519 [Suillus brevipes Sb2]
MASSCHDLILMRLYFVAKSTCFGVSSTLRFDNFKPEHCGLWTWSRSPLQPRLSSPSLCPNIRRFSEMTQTHFSASIGTRRRAGDHVVMKRQRDFYRSVTIPTTSANGPGTSSANPPVNIALATTRRGLAQLSVGAQASLRGLRGSCARVANYITSVGSRP